MSDAQIAFGLAKLRDIKAVESGDAQTLGIGIMSEDRWRRTRDAMVDTGLLKPETEWRRAFTLDYISGLDVTM